MRKNGLIFILLILNSFKTEASFYSTTNNARYTYEELLSNFDLVVLTSKDCIACKNLLNEIQKCSMPAHFKVAWVGSQVSKYQFYRNNFSKIKTSEKNIEKLTQVTPKTILKGRVFKEGAFGCKEFEKAI
jgi:hypothetical protein